MYQTEEEQTNEFTKQYKNNKENCGKMLQLWEAGPSSQGLLGERRKQEQTPKQLED
jgi:hypothetical protein